MVENIFSRVNNLKRYKIQSKENKNKKKTEKARPLNEYFQCVSSIEEINIKTKTNTNRINSINIKINKLEILIDHINKQNLKLIDVLIDLYNSNSSTKKQFNTNLELEKNTKKLEQIIYAKKKLLIIKKNYINR